jgi:predicted nucleic acid-binding protein
MVIFDSSVLIDQFRTDRYRERIYSLNDLVRNSAVVLAELMRGATTRAEHETIEDLKRRYATFTPTHSNWLDSGTILADMVRDHGFQGHKLRDLHFDVLIALTARTHGARLITSNRADFELIRKYRAFKLEVW